MQVRSRDKPNKACCMLSSHSLIAVSPPFSTEPHSCNIAGRPPNGIGCQPLEVISRSTSLPHGQPPPTQSLEKGAAAACTAVEAAASDQEALVWGFQEHCESRACQGRRGRPHGREFPAILVCGAAFPFLDVTHDCVFAVRRVRNKLSCPTTPSCTAQKSTYPWPDSSCVNR